MTDLVALQRILGDARIVAIICKQWGDTGKGKFVDLFAEWADYIVRGTGGGNAGHTVVVGDKTYVLHMVPCGVTWGSYKTNIIGRGVAFDPVLFFSELGELSEAGISGDNVLVDLRAYLTLPIHILLDMLSESSSGAGKIGTTGRGIGPVYTDHVARRGLIVNDLLNPDVLRRKLLHNLERQTELKVVDPAQIHQLMQHERLGSGAFYSPATGIDVDAVVDHYTALGVQLRDRACVRDTVKILREAVGTKNILLEGAQGTLLSVNHGTYPKVTSSDCTAHGLALGAGLSPGDIDHVFGVVKFPWMTRVGAGAFPTELGAGESERWCDTATRPEEEAAHPNVSINDPDPLRRGIAIRQIGGEFGATTGRLRRTGAIDLPLLRYALSVGGGANSLILTKVDVMDGADEIEVCTNYRYTGPDYVIGERVLRRDDLIGVACPWDDVLRHCEPVIQRFPGWKTPTSHMTTKEELPAELLHLITLLENLVERKVAIVSVGPDRNQTIVLQHNYQ